MERRRTPPAGKSAGSRLKGLDALRGLAALAVVLHHFTARYPQITGQNFPVPFSFPQGQYGVQLFFMISGYVIFMTLERTRGASDFVVSRVARLWPCYLACLMITLTVVLVASPSWYPAPSGSGVLKNLTMAPQLLGTAPVDTSYWSLIHEIVFYALAGGSYFLLGARRTDHLCLLWLLLMVAMWGLAKYSGFELGYSAVTLTGTRYAPYFVTGVMIYRLRQESRTRFTVLVLVLAVALAGWRQGWHLVPISRAGYAALMAGCAAIVWLGTLPRSPFAYLRPLVFLGDISYPLYLVHQVVGYVLLARLGTLGLPPGPSVLVAVVMMILVAFLVSRLVEKPCQRWIRHAYAGLREARTEPVPAIVPAETLPSPLPRARDHSGASTSRMFPVGQP